LQHVQAPAGKGQQRPAGEGLGRQDGNYKRYLERTIHGTKRQAADVLNELLLEAGQSSNAIVEATSWHLAQRRLEWSSATLSPTTLSPTTLR
jgi:hypothetical protein